MEPALICAVGVDTCSGPSLSCPKPMVVVRKYGLAETEKALSVL